MLNEQERELLDASAKRRWLILAGIWFGSAIVVLLVAAFTVYLFVTEKSRAKDARDAEMKIGKVASRADLSLAIVALEKDELSRALPHLARALRADSNNSRAAAIACSTVLYGEWGLTRSEAMNHEGGIWSAHLSPDGQRVVTASWDGTARLWDAASGKALGEPMKHEEGSGPLSSAPMASAWSPLLGRDSAALGCGERKGAGRADEA